MWLHAKKHKSHNFYRLIEREQIHAQIPNFAMNIEKQYTQPAIATSTLWTMVSNWVCTDSSFHAYIYKYSIGCTPAIGSDKVSVRCVYAQSQISAVQLQ